MPWRQTQEANRPVPRMVMAKKQSRAYRHQKTPSSVPAATATDSSVTAVGYTARMSQFPTLKNAPTQITDHASVRRQPVSFLHTAARTAPSSNTAAPAPIRAGMAASQLSIWFTSPFT